MEKKKNLILKSYTIDVTHDLNRNDLITVDFFHLCGRAWFFCLRNMILSFRIRVLQISEDYAVGATFQTT